MINYNRKGTIMTSKNEKRTDELEKILEDTHSSNASSFLKENADSLITCDKAFAEYMRNKINERGLNRQNIFLRADLPERYGYKLLSEEKRTKQRDIILRLCYASELSLEETQEALRLYGMPELYARIPRDAILMIAFNEKHGDVIDVNQLLHDNNMPLLRTSGTLD